MNFIASGIEPSFDENDENELKQCIECKGLYYCLIEGLCIGCYQQMEIENWTEADRIEDQQFKWGER